MKFQSFPRRFALLAMTLSAMAALPAVGQTMNESFKLLPDDAESNDMLGHSVAVSGNIAIIGAPGDEDNGDFSGSAYLFDTNTGQQLFKLLPNDGAEDDWFGVSVAISGTTAIVGAFLDDNIVYNSGAAYLFDTTTGQQIAKLLPNDGGTDDQFGISVAISGTIAVVGARRDDDIARDSGSAYLFDTTTGQQIAKLLPDSESAYTEFGYSVAISDNLVIVGARFDGRDFDDSGAAYLFNATDGHRIAKLLASDGARDDYFGHSVAISGTTAIVGAFEDDDNGAESGSAYLFDATTGQELAKLLPDDGAAGDEFGRAVAISGTTAVVGANRDDDSGSNSGSAYFFDTTTGQQINKLLPSDGSGGDLFSWSVAISGATTVVGARDDTDNAIRSGSAYVFSTVTCPPDLTGDGTLNFFDVSAFITAYAANDPTADFNTDGIFNFFDVSAFIVAYQAGCP